eukprot:6985679-Heterocapsa_arctica.AAC.1
MELIMGGGTGREQEGVTLFVFHTGVWNTSFLKTEDRNFMLFQMLHYLFPVTVSLRPLTLRDAIPR